MSTPRSYGFKETPRFSCLARGETPRSKGHLEVLEKSELSFENSAFVSFLGWTLRSLLVFQGAQNLKSLSEIAENSEFSNVISPFQRQRMKHQKLWDLAVSSSASETGRFHLKTLSFQRFQRVTSGFGGPWSSNRERGDYPRTDTNAEFSNENSEFSRTFRWPLERGVSLLVGQVKRGVSLEPQERGVDIGRQWKLVTKIHANLVFQACISVLKCFRTSGIPIKKSECTLECYPVLSLHGIKFCQLVSRSDLVVEADHSLDVFGTQEAQLQGNLRELEGKLRKWW